MSELLTLMLGMGGISSLRHDDSVNRQGVMNHQTACHLMDLSFIRDATEMSIPESYAVQGLAMSFLPGQAAGLNTSTVTPPAASKAA